MSGRNMALKFIRRYFNKTQTDMGQLIGKTQAGYSDIENGRQGLKEAEIKIICRELGIDPNIFTTELPETEWYGFMKKPEVMREPEPEYVKKCDGGGFSIIMIEKERIEKELEAYREENHKLKVYIREYIDKGQQFGA